jgi:hypothetical protein
LLFGSARARPHPWSRTFVANAACAEPSAPRISLFCWHRTVAPALDARSFDPVCELIGRPWEQART